MNTPVRRHAILVILDGWGHRESEDHNAIAQTPTPFFDSLLARYPHTLLHASGTHVGLPDGQSGNSEIGHMTIGAGRVINTDLVRITKAFKDDTAGDNTTLRSLFAHTAKHRSTLHLVGLLSPGGVHSHHNHLHDIIRLAKRAGITTIAVHAFTDGRDTPPQSAHIYLRELEQVLDREKVGFIATASGRFYAMDRDHNWDRVKRAEDALFHSIGTAHTKKPSEVLAALHAQGITDEHLEPIIFCDEAGKTYAIEENDGVLFFNFRPDRARMLSRRIMERAQGNNIFFATMTEHDATLPVPAVFSAHEPGLSLAQIISEAGLTQAHIAETEKYAHATYFLNGKKELCYPNEEDVLIESRKDILTHDHAPKMRAAEITDAVIERIARGIDFIFVNYANADMVGHTAKVAALRIAIHEIDLQLERLVAAAEKENIPI
ncbi:MAG: 2,3-bisphosphoglycerate-independent phosphoglycerate mutase, partial [Patescibacteria group bacterium]